MSTHPNEFPILKLELDTSRVAILRALDDRHAELVAMINKSMDRAVEHIQSQLDDKVYTALRVVMDDAIERASAMACDGIAERLAESMAEQVRKTVMERMDKK